MNTTLRTLTILSVFSLLALAAACGGDANGGMKQIADKKVGDDLTVTLSNSAGQLKNGEQEIMLTFTDGAGKPVEIEAASLNFNMPAMGSMAEMNNPATLTTTETPGQFKGKVDIEMAGEWIAQISYEGAQDGKTTMPVTAY
jgi:nitrogen fixation protein FixH